MPPSRIVSKVIRGMGLTGSVTVAAVLQGIIGHPVTQVTMVASYMSREHYLRWGSANVRLAVSLSGTHHKVWWAVLLSQRQYERQACCALIQMSRQTGSASVKGGRVCVKVSVRLAVSFIEGQAGTIRVTVVTSLQGLFCIRIACVMWMDV